MKTSLISIISEADKTQEDANALSFPQHYIFIPIFTEGAPLGAVWLFQGRWFRLNTTVTLECSEHKASTDRLQARLRVGCLLFVAVPYPQSSSYGN